MCGRLYGLIKACILDSMLSMLPSPLKYDIHSDMIAKRGGKVQGLVCLAYVGNECSLIPNQKCPYLSLRYLLHICKIILKACIYSYLVG